MTFKETVYEVIMDEIASMYEFPLINLICDICTINSVDCIIVASISFIGLKWIKRYLALIFQKHILGFSAASVSSNIKATMACEYPDVNIVETIWYVVSDTVVLVRNVAAHFYDAS